MNRPTLTKEFNFKNVSDLTEFTENIYIFLKEYYLICSVQKY